jgi:hypothetical protein
MGFIAPGKQLSIARVQIALGFACLGFLLLRASLWQAPAAAGAEVMTYTFVVAAIIILVGMIALVLEERLTWLPPRVRVWLEISSIAVQNDARARSKPAGESTGAPPDSQQGSAAQDAPQGSATPSVQRRPAIPRWGLAGGRGLPDIAVGQLLVVIVVLPILMFIWRKLPVEGWRIVLIVALSEMVYLAFLGAQIVKTKELAELQTASLDLDKRLEELAKETLDLDKRLEERATASLDQDQPVAGQSAEDKKNALEAERQALQDKKNGFEAARRALQARAAALWEQLSPMFESTAASPERDLDGGKAAAEASQQREAPGRAVSAAE